MGSNQCLPNYSQSFFFSFSTDDGEWKESLRHKVCTKALGKRFLILRCPIIIINWKRGMRWWKRFIVSSSWEGGGAAAGGTREKSTAACNLSTKCTSWWWKWNGKSMKQSVPHDNLTVTFSSSFCHKRMRDMLVAASRISARVFWFCLLFLRKLRLRWGGLRAQILQMGRMCFSIWRCRESNSSWEDDDAADRESWRLRGWDDGVKLFPSRTPDECFCILMQIHIYIWVWEGDRVDVVYEKKRSWREWHGVWAEDEKKLLLLLLLVVVVVVIVIVTVRLCPSFDL